MNRNKQFAEKYTHFAYHKIKFSFALHHMVGTNNIKAGRISVFPTGGHEDCYFLQYNAVYPSKSQLISGGTYHLHLRGQINRVTAEHCLLCAFILVSCPAYLAPELEPVCSYKTPADFQWNTWHCIP
jgi:hypothetical protein